MNETAAILVLTLMLPEGETGVQTHFNQVIQHAWRRGVKATIVHPYEYYWFARKGVSLVTRFLQPVCRERMVLWGRWTHYWFLRRLLRQHLKGLDSHSIVLYAQDPLSARAALAERRCPLHRVVEVVHFNVSEAEEGVTKGLTDAGGLLYRSLMANEKAVLPRVDLLLFVSRFAERQVLPRLPELSSVPRVVIPNFVAESEGGTGHKSLLGDIISIGTLEPRKNQSFLLQVLAATRARGRQYQLTLVGDGPDRGRLEAFARKLNILDQLTFTGFVPQAARLLPHFRVYAHAATMENFPLVLLEAMAQGLPLLAAPVGGIPEVFDDGIEGRYWSLHDELEAAQQLMSVLDQPATYAALSAGARRRFLREYSADVVGDRCLNALLRKKP